MKSGGNFLPLHWKFLGKSTVMLRALRRFTLLLSPFLLLSASLFAQENVSFSLQEAAMARALELFNAGKFAVAESAFAQAQELSATGVSMRQADAAFYRALCALRLERGDAISQMVSFTERFPESRMVNEARYELGEAYYRNKKYEEAHHWFSVAQTHAFSHEQQSELLFKRGYSLFRLNRKDEAFSLFARTKDDESYYSAPSRYFYAHIAYETDRNTAALEEFLQLENDPSFAPIVPYYISQIYYRQRQYDRVIEYVTPLADSLTGSRGLEMQRMLADAYFRQGQYEKALPPMEKYAEGTDILSREDNYLIGFVYYKNNQYQPAIAHLERVITENDALSQNANYHLADCYLRMNDRERAQKALQMASSVDFDKEVQEDALFNFAKLTYDLRFSAYGSAVDAFLKYIELFPTSNRVDEAYTYLGIAFTETKNYQRALDALEKISRTTPLTQRATQRAAYFRGVELFQNLRFPEAERLFAQSLRYAEYDPTLSAKALYWRAESLYRLQQYPTAAAEYQKFLHARGAFSLSEFSLAPYAVGYCYFQMKNYDQSATWFRQFVGALSADATYASLRTDALCRIADCYYMQRKYWPAIEFYEKAAKSGGVSADYAVFQQGFTLGLVARPEKKIAVLQDFHQQFPQSLYRPDVYFELAQTYHSLDDLSRAKAYYQQVVDNFPSSPYAPSALVQMGLVCYAESEYELAIRNFTRVVSEFPGTPQMHEAVAALEKVYNSMGDVSSYLAYLDGIGQSQKVSQPQRDSLYFTNAQEFYMSGDCSRAVPALRDYIREYPQGFGSIAANFYLADCLLRAHDSVAALESLQLVVSRAPNEYFDRAQRQLCAVLEFTRDWEEALEGYLKLERMTNDQAVLLEARRGKLHMAVILQGDERIAEYAIALLSTDKLPPELALYGRYQLANAQLRLGRVESAYATFAQIGQNTGSITGAEARFRMVEIRHRQKDWERTKEEVLAFSKQNTPHQYWLAKSFILLADSYYQQGDSFQAKATLQSIIDNYLDRNDGIVKEAEDARHAIIYKEATTFPMRRPTDTIQFNFE